jgi:hypothetical protein
MTPAEHLEAVKERLLTDPVVAGFQVRRERYTITDAHLRVRVAIVDGSLLEFSEYVAILERFVKQKHGQGIKPDEMADRLIKASELLAKQKTTLR